MIQKPKDKSLIVYIEPLRIVKEISELHSMRLIPFFITIDLEQ